MEERIFAAIDLKSFYASAECIERGLDPLDTCLVVADCERTDKTICLAVSPALKSFGIPGRPRLFEVRQKVSLINAERRQTVGGTHSLKTFKQDTSLKLEPIIAPPRMSYYMDVSSQIYRVYLQYVSDEDIFAYSIDEVFIDLTKYLPLYKRSPRDLTMMLIREVLKATGITATAGIGTNLYLAKIAMDIMAKHMPADKDGVRIAEMDEMSYRRNLWSHRPLTDFWRVGRGTAKRLEANGIRTMGDLARCSLGEPGRHFSEDLLYKLFGVNAELLIDHAWGWEPCTIADIKAYHPENNSLCSGQVLKTPYTLTQGEIVIREMADQLSFQLVEKRLVCDQLVLTVGYDIENLNDAKRMEQYHGEVTRDYYGRDVPKPAHGSQNLGRFTSSSRLITEGAVALYHHVLDEGLLVRRFYLTANHVLPETEIPAEDAAVQRDLFTDYAALEIERNQEEARFEKERRQQEAVLAIRKKFGKNAILKGTSLQEDATARERNGQIGGHRA